MEDIKIYVVPKWKLPFGFGIALWNTVIVREDGDIPYLIAHEMEHIRQQHKLGKWKFIYKYTKELYKNGYHLNSFEVEARAVGSVNRHKYLDYIQGEVSGR